MYRGNIFAVDFTDLEKVVEVAKQLGPDQVVIKVPGRPNYNITFKSRVPTGAQVVWPTRNYGTAIRHIDGEA